MTMAGELVFTVSKLNEYADRVLKNDPRLRSIKVSGEISGFKRHSSGHLYFNLKDKDAVVACVMFRSSAASLKIVPADGMQVVVHGSVSIYPRDGKYQLYADSMKETGEGELYMQYLLLKDKLEREGVFQNERDLPVLPRCIGVATSRTGAALHDIITVTRRRFPAMRILLAPCQVQGENAPGEIISAINALQRFPYCDVIIVGRGGGSYEDLYCFNDEGVARAIAASRVPVISAVGHETDFTIADFAADRRAPTPSAAAELCCPVYSELMDDTLSLKESLGFYASGRLQEARKALSGLTGSSAMANPGHAVSLLREKLRAVSGALDTGIKTALLSAESQLMVKKERLKALGPAEVMARGYSIVTDEEGNIIRSADSLSIDMPVKIRLSDGRASAAVTAVEKEKANER
jgi:exodeoxyribonuclease VII large subunit